MPPIIKGIDVTYNCSNIIFITIYFRNPGWVKLVLRPIRVGLGPSSILVALYVSATQMWIGTELLGLMRTCLAMIVFTSAFLAGVVLRPDNLEVLNPIKSILTLPSIDLKGAHGAMNLTSVFISMLMSFTY